ncbi:MAG: 5-formyltetrahydrofolate cyclo-ligase [Scytonema sp. PMC 1069.18]|nr:5-formyltetrahydrofolate cyclo-ligase [Scytonema sp. PMC 1069.18]MEC4887624.1 5-formyltetrahydrofolate cyclo-ligase [Scytonema sp. PMC 1070.18]
MGKKELRKSFLKQRQSMSVAEWREKSDRITQNLLTSPLFYPVKTILAYFSFRQEPDLGLLFTDTSHCWGFPRCVGDLLYWHLWTPNDSIITGAYGISEPHPNAPTIEPAEVDLILVPCVACDYQGYRLGYGGGYYDRLLSYPKWVSKTTIGIVFDFAYVPQLPIESWDKPLQGVCTENGLHMVKC